MKVISNQCEEDVSGLLSKAYKWCYDYVTVTAGNNSQTQHPRRRQNSTGWRNNEPECPANPPTPFSRTRHTGAISLWFECEELTSSTHENVYRTENDWRQWIQVVSFHSTAARNFFFIPLHAIALREPVTEPNTCVRSLKIEANCLAPVLNFICPTQGIWRVWP